MQTSTNRLSFDKQISLGHIVQAVTVLFVAVGAYIAFEKRLYVVEVDTKEQKVNTRRHSEMLDEILKVQQNIAVTQARITTILEERSKK